LGRGLQARIDQTALLHNLQRVREIAHGQKIIAMIKANAYGHGLVAVAKILQNADAFGVASLEEAIELRQAGIKNRIICMEGFISEFGLKQTISWQLDTVIHHKFQLELLEKKAPGKVKSWIKINTGMNRLGFTRDGFLQNFSRLIKCCDIAGIMTHFSDANILNTTKTKQQIATFSDITVNLNKHYPCSLANSAGILAWPESHGDWVRPGLMLYGVSPFFNSNGDAFNLKPAMHLVAKIIAINLIRKNETIGYASRFVCPEDMAVGVISIGYADGYPSIVPDGTPVLVHQRKSNIIGKISMDMATIDLRGHTNVKIGDEVTLWGNGLPIEKIARKIGIIPYELLTSLSTRATRVYTKEFLPESYYHCYKEHKTYKN